MVDWRLRTTDRVADVFDLKAHAVVLALATAALVSALLGRRYLAWRERRAEQTISKDR